MSNSESNKMNLGNIVRFLNKYKHIQFTENILDFSGTNLYWKRRFTNDVLSQINKYFRFCGLVCSKHRFNRNSCNCSREELIPCANCYSYGWCTIQNEDHVQWDLVSLEEIKQKKCCTLFSRCPYLPNETYIYIDQNRYMTFATIRNDLPIKLYEERIQYLRRNDPENFEEMVYLMEKKLDRKANHWWWR